jgi:hypothetical protein
VTAYVDSSVVLRIVLGEAGRLREWRRIERAFASELIRLECLRTIDRARLRLGLADGAVAAHRAAVFDLLDSFDLVKIDDAVLERAADPFPTTLGPPPARARRRPVPRDPRHGARDRRTGSRTRGPRRSAPLSSR